MSPIRVLVVDDDALVRAGLTVMLGGTPTLRIVGEAADGCEVPDAVRRLRPDVVLMDIRMPQVDGVTATERLRRADAPKVIILTTFDADRQVLAALRAGAAGFLLKDTRPADIVRAIETVAAGDATLSPTITRQVIAMLGTGEQGAERAAARARVAGLTDRERDVARGVARGLPNAEIAATTYLSVATVKAYVSRLLDKLDLDNRVQLALLVAQADTDD